MPLAPVVDLNTARRRLIAQRLLALGCPLATITATRTDTELDDLWRRERTIASLRQLTGRHRNLYDLWNTDELVELEARTVRQLMGAARGSGDDRLIHSIGGHQPRDPRTRQRQRLREWGLPA